MRHPMKSCSTATELAVDHRAYSTKRLGDCADQVNAVRFWEAHIYAWGAIPFDFGRGVGYQEPDAPRTRTREELLSRVSINADSLGEVVNQLVARARKERPTASAYRVIAEANRLFADLDAAVEHSPLPDRVELDAIGRLVTQIYLEAWEQWGWTGSRPTP